MTKMSKITNNIEPILFVTMIQFVVFLLQNSGSIQVNFLLFQAQMLTFVLIVMMMLFGSADTTKNAHQHKNNMHPLDRLIEQGY